VESMLLQLDDSSQYVLYMVIYESNHF